MPPLPINMASTLTEQAAKLLDFNQKLDINLLDNVVSCMHAGEGQQVRKSTEFKLFRIKACLHLTFACASVFDAKNRIHGYKWRSLHLESQFSRT